MQDTQDTQITQIKKFKKIKKIQDTQIKKFKKDKKKFMTLRSKLNPATVLKQKLTILPVGYSQESTVALGFVQPVASFEEHYNLPAIDFEHSDMHS